MGSTRSSFNQSRVVLIIIPRLFAALTAYMFIVIRTNVSYASDNFRAPTIFRCPVMTMESAYAVSLTIVTMITRPRSIRVTRIGVNVVTVRARGAAIRAFTGPMTRFELCRPILSLSIFKGFPKVMITQCVGDRFFHRNCFGSRIQDANNPMRNVNFSNRLKGVDFYSLLLYVCTYNGCGRRTYYWGVFSYSRFRFNLNFCVGCLQSWASREKALLARARGGIVKRTHWRFWTGGYCLGGIEVPGFSFSPKGEIGVGGRLWLKLRLFSFLRTGFACALGW